MKYHCCCGMSAEVKCGNCGADMRDVVLKVKGEEIHASECVKGCGKIKSPICCGHDMEPEE